MRCRTVVNAAGVWADEIRALDEGADPDTLRPAKGIHITLPWAKVQADIAAVIPVPKDRRSLFVVPWGELVYVGTTDTDYDGPLDDPQCTPEDIAYVLRALNRSITTGITERDILGTWAGLRPLVKRASSGRTADLSRRHSVPISPQRRHHRHGWQAHDVPPHGCRRGRRSDGPPRPRGSEPVRTDAAARRDGFREADPGSPAAHLVGSYGTEATFLEQLIRADPSLAEPLVPGLPYLRAEAVYAARHEMAVTLDDVLSRRTRARLLARDDSVDAALAVAALVGPELGWSEDECRRQVDGYAASVAHERHAAGLPETALDAALGA